LQTVTPKICLQTLQFSWLTGVFKMPSGALIAAAITNAKQNNNWKDYGTPDANAGSGGGGGTSVKERGEWVPNTDFSEVTYIYGNRRSRGQLFGVKNDAPTSAIFEVEDAVATLNEIKMGIYTRPDGSLYTYSQFQADVKKWVDRGGQADWQ
jgi:hypothetical protein